MHDSEAKQYRMINLDKCSVAANITEYHFVTKLFFNAKQIASFHGYLPWTD